MKHGSSVWSEHLPTRFIKAYPEFALGLTRVQDNHDYDGQATFNSAKCTLRGGSSERLSVSLGFAIRWKFLGTSVTGQYDRDILRNNDVSILRLEIWYLYQSMSLCRGTKLLRGQHIARVPSSP